MRSDRGEGAHIGETDNAFITRGDKQVAAYVERVDALRVRQSTLIAARAQIAPEDPPVCATDDEHVRGLHELDTPYTSASSGQREAIDKGATRHIPDAQL